MAIFATRLGVGLSIHIPVDRLAAPDASVVIHRPTASINDVYLLKADILENVNMFRRHQIVFNPETKKYTLLGREGRVGLEGVGKREFESKDLKRVADRFRQLFRTKTGRIWGERYDLPFARTEDFTFVELDYNKITSPKELPSYPKTDVKVHEELKDLMELMLYGGLMQKRTDRDSPGTSRSWSPFSAPYEQLGPWTIFSAFKTLEHIWRRLESGSSIHWKAILRASSRYRSQTPFCAAHDRLPVISSYHAIFREPKFLYSLWPRQEIANMLTEIHCRGSLQLNAYRALTCPLYQAYSSLRHGFRRLTDASTFEFRELKSCLENSCHHVHYPTLELQDIYRVFIKTNLPNPYGDWIDGKQGLDICGEEKLLLWHGTPLSSLLGILDLGLQVRREGVPWTGTMFGNDIYLADVSSKSAGYCKSGSWGEETVLLLSEADVGSQRIRSRKCIYDGHSIIEKSTGRNRCIEGLGKVRPVKWTKVEWEMGGLPCTGQGRVLMVC